MSIFFILSKNISLPEIIHDATKYGAMFDEKLFWNNLIIWGYHRFLSEYLGNTFSEEHIKHELQKKIRAYLQQKQAIL